VGVRTTAPMALSEARRQSWARQQWIALPLSPPWASWPCPAEGPWRGRRPERLAWSPQSRGRSAGSDIREIKSPGLTQRTSTIGDIPTLLLHRLTPTFQCPLVLSYNRCGGYHSRCSNSSVAVLGKAHCRSTPSKSPLKTSILNTSPFQISPAHLPRNQPLPRCILHWSHEWEQEP